MGDAFSGDGRTGATGAVGLVDRVPWQSGAVLAGGRRQRASDGCSGQSASRPYRGRGLVHGIVGNYIVLGATFLTALLIARRLSGAGKI